MLVFLYKRNGWMLDFSRIFSDYRDIKIDRPLFLLGTEAGGLTFVSRTLRRHKDFVSVSGNYKYWSGADEMQLVLGPILPFEFSGIKHKRPKRLKMLGLTGNCLYATGDFISYYRKTKEDVTPEIRERFRKIIRWQINRHAIDKKTARFIDKSQVFTVKVSFINEILKDTNPKFILITRNPYALAYKFSRTNIKNYVTKIGGTHEQAVEIAAQHWANSINYAMQDGQEADLLVVRFEDFLQNPEKELKKILSLDYSYKVFALMDEYGVLEILFPEIKPMKGINQGGYHHLDVWEHSLESLKVLERKVLPKFLQDEFIKDYLVSFNSNEMAKKHLLKLGTLFHDIGKPQAKSKTDKRTIFYCHDKIGSDIVKSMFKKLKFSSKDTSTISNLVLWHMLPAYLADAPKFSRKAVFRFFRKTSPDTIAVILLSLADLDATKGRDFLPEHRRRHKKVMKYILKEYNAYLNDRPVKRVINGRDVMAVLKIPPSPKVGRVLEYIFEKQDLGLIKTKQQALKEVRKVFKQEEVCK